MTSKVTERIKPKSLKCLRISCDQTLFPLRHHFLLIRPGRILNKIFLSQSHCHSSCESKFTFLRFPRIWAVNSYRQLNVLEGSLKHGSNTQATFFSLHGCCKAVAVASVSLELPQVSHMSDTVEASW